MAAAANNVLNINSYLLEKARESLKKKPRTAHNISATLQNTLTKEYLRDLPEKNVNKFFKHGKTPLTEAISREFVRKSISCDPESNEYENDNKNDIVDILISKGADVNKVDKFRDPVSKRANFSPLATAIFDVSSGSLYKCVIEDLFKAGAKFDITAKRELIQAKKDGEDDLCNYVIALEKERQYKARRLPLLKSYSNHPKRLNENRHTRRNNKNKRKNNNTRRNNNNVNMKKNTANPNPNNINNLSNL